MLSETGSGISKTHVAVLSVVVLVASASAAVNIRDPMNVFGDLNVRGGELDMHQNQITNTTEVEFSSDYLKKYAGQDGKIDDAGLAQANQDFGSDKLSASQLRTVETFFQNKIPVKNNILEQYDNNENNKIDRGELNDAIDAFLFGEELSKGEINLIQYYFRNNVPITEPASSIDAAKITNSGKLIASGIIGRQKANFTIGNDINMQGNNIYNAGNLNGQTGGTTGRGGGGEVETFGYSNVATDSTSGFETIRTETFNPDKGVSVLGGYAEVTQDISYGDEPARARIRVTYEDGSEKTFESVGIKVSPNDPGYTGDPPAPIYPSDTLKQPAVTEIHFEYKGSRSGGSDDEDRAKFRIDLIQGGTSDVGGDSGSLSGSPVFGSVSYTKMGETSEFVTPNDYENVKTLSTGESVSVSRTAQLGGTTKFRVLGGIVNRDTDGPPPSGRHFGDAIQRDLGYVQLLVDGEVVSEVQELNEWSAATRMPTSLWIRTVNNRREPVMTTDPISVETGDTVTAKVAADQEVDTDEVGSGGVGSFYQYVVLKRVDK